MAGLYEIHLFDRTGTRQKVLSGWNYLDFTQRINSPWNHQFSINVGLGNSEIIDFFRNSLETNWLVEVHRIDSLTNTEECVYEGFHRTLVEQITSEDVVRFTSYGTGYADLLITRIIIPPVGDENVVKSGTAEPVIKQFINEQAITGTVVDAARAISGLSIAGNFNRGAAVAYTARYTILMTAVRRCAEEGGLDFGVYRPLGAARGTFEFDVATLWGEDRTRDNTDGNDAVVFDLFAGTMEIPIFSKNAGDEISYVYIGGEGQGIDREIREVEDAARTAIEWNRREGWVDARREGDMAGLDQAGQDELARAGYKEKFTFNVRQTDALYWPEHYGMGDLVEALYFDTYFDMKINEISVTVTGTEGSRTEVISAELEIQ